MALLGFGLGEGLGLVYGVVVGATTGGALGAGFGVLAAFAAGFVVALPVGALCGVALHVLTKFHRARAPGGGTAHTYRRIAGLICAAVSVPSYVAAMAVQGPGGAGALDPFELLYTFGAPGLLAACAMWWSGWLVAGQYARGPGSDYFGGG